MAKPLNNKPSIEPGKAPAPELRGGPQCETRPGGGWDPSTPFHRNPRRAAGMRTASGGGDGGVAKKKERPAWESGSEGFWRLLERRIFN